MATEKPSKMNSESFRNSDFFEAGNSADGTHSNVKSEANTKFIKKISLKELEKFLDDKFSPYQIWIYFLACLAAVVPGAAVVGWSFIGFDLDYR